MYQKEIVVDTLDGKYYSVIMIKAAADDVIDTLIVEDAAYLTSHL